MPCPVQDTAVALWHLSARDWNDLCTVTSIEHDVLVWRWLRIVGQPALRIERVCIGPQTGKSIGAEVGEMYCKPLRAAHRLNHVHDDGPGWDDSAIRQHIGFERHLRVLSVESAQSIAYVC